MTSGPSFRALFNQLVLKPDEDIHLDLAALYMAGEEYPELDVTSNLARLDELATQVSARVIYGAEPAAVSRAIVGYLFHEMGFHHHPIIHEFHQSVLLVKCYLYSTTCHHCISPFYWSLC